MRGAGLILLAVVIASTLANGQTDEAIHRQQVRDEARANVNVMHDALMAHEWDSFVIAARGNLKLASELGSDPDLLDWLTAIAARTTVHRNVIEGVVANGMPEGVCEDLWQDYRDMSVIPVDRAIEKEKRRALARYEDRGREFRKFIDVLFGAYQDILSDDEERQQSGRQAAADLVARAKRGEPNSISEFDLVAIDNVRRTRDQNCTVQLGVRTVLALELYQSAHGEYPDSLDKLTPELLPEVPIDPYNGKPFGYRLIDAENDPLGRGYILYVVGIDGEDNGGERHPDLNIEALGSNSGRGFDYVISDPRD